MPTKILVLVAIIWFPLISVAQTYEKRLALVIGNSSYQNGGSLKNPVNDARSVASSLQGMGFEVMRFENVTQAQMKQAINSYGIKLKDYQVGLFYYAGHGIQHKGTNYMIPVEADLQAEEQIEFDCVAADRVLAYMDAAATKVNIIIMDACRNNPFERSWHRSVNGSGLAMMNAPTGTLIAYATAPGKVASDGESANGLYTSILLKYMKDPALNLEQVFKRVRTEVTEKSSGAQVPWETTSLTGSDFFLTSTSAKTTTEAKPISPSSTASGQNREVAVEGEDPEKALQYYTQAMEKYDQGFFNEAIDLFTKSVNANPMDPSSYLWRGHCKYSLGYKNGEVISAPLEEAITDYTKTLQLNRAEPEAYYYRASAKKLLNRLKESIPDFTLAIKYNPKGKDIYYFRGLTYYLLETHVAAIEDFEEVIKLDPEYVSAYLFKAHATYGLGDYKAAITLYEDALLRDPSQSEGALFYAHCFYNLGEYQTALDNYLKVLSIDPKYADVYYWRSRVFTDMGQKDNAIKEIKKALALAPNNETYISQSNSLK